MLPKPVFMIHLALLLVNVINCQRIKQSNSKIVQNNVIPSFKNLKDDDQVLFNKNKTNRNFGFLDKNLFTPDEYNKYRTGLKNRQRIEQEKVEKAERKEKMIRDKIFRLYLLPRVGGSFLKDFNARF